LKNCHKNVSLIKIWQAWQVVYMKIKTHLWSYHIQFFLEWEMLQTVAGEKIKTHILRSKTFFQKARHLWDNVVGPDTPQMT
jgi:hypothetical protein